MTRYFDVGYLFQVVGHSMSIVNARIYNLGDNDFEAKYSPLGWLSKTQTNDIPKRVYNSRGQSPDYEKNREKVVSKAKGNLRRKIKRFKLDRFWTLTFAENLEDVKEADKTFSNFMKRIHRRFPAFKYICTREFLERGAVHYHVAVNMYIPKQLLDGLWGKGFTWIERDQVGRNRLYRYLSKYMTKYCNDERLKGFHLYLCSQGLNILHFDMCFDSQDAFLNYLSDTYGNLTEKFIKFYEDTQLLIVI